MSEVIGTTAALHVPTFPVRIVHTITSKTGVYHVALDEAPGFKSHIAPHALIKIAGPVTARLLAPASADIVISAAASIVPTNPLKWPTDLTGVRAEVSSQPFAVSALTPVPTAVLGFHPAINTTLKPKPVTGRHPALLVGWRIDTTQTSFSVDLAVSFEVEFSGADWVEPSSW